MRRSRAADIRYLVGVSGTGKTHDAIAMLRAHLRRKRTRALVWDWKDDHPGIPADSLATLAQLPVGWTGARRYRPDFNTDPARPFELFCRIAWAHQAADPATDCLFMVEELSEVTTASNAPPWWRRIVVQGRVYGFIVVGTTQSPAYVDKGFTSSATMIRAGRLGEYAHANVIAQRLAADQAEKRRLTADLQRLPDRAAYVFDGRKTRFVPAK